MNKNIIKKTLVFGLIILFIGSIITPSISGNVSKINDVKSLKTREINNAIQTEEREPNTISDTDWWPMFRHDTGNTGSTTSAGPDTNELYWKVTIPDEIFSATPIIYNDRMYISTNFFYKDFEPPTIMDKSIFEVPDFTGFINDLFTYNDEYYGGIYCLDAEKGTQLWDYPLYAPNDPLIVDDKVYVTDLDGYLYCLNAENGNLNWYKFLGELALSPTIGADDKIFLGCLDFDYYSYSYDGSLKCLDFDGNSKWTYHLPENETIWFSAPAYCDDKVYFISLDVFSYYSYELESKLYCLNADTGQYIWSQPINTFGSYFFFGTNSPVCKDGKVFVVELDIDYYTYSFDSNLTCFNADTGSLIWNYPLGYSICLGTPAVSQDSVFIACFDIFSYSSLLYRISTNGVLVWKVPIPGIAYFASSGTPVCSANKVFVCPWEYSGYTSVICCTDIANGNFLWSSNLDYMSLAYPSIANERVYLADMIGNIYAFGSLGEPPTPPIIDGPSEGSDGKELCWTFHSNDTDGDMVKYHIDWGDGNSSETDFNASCTPVEVCHTYEERGEYNITAYAEDEKGLVSGESKVTVTIPRARTKYHSLLLRMFERFPALYLILRLLV